MVRQIDPFGELFVVLFPSLDFPILVLKKATTGTIRARARVVVLRLLKILRVLEAYRAIKINAIEW
jgi:hypothetical protein